METDLTSVIEGEALVTGVHGRGWVDGGVGLTRYAVVGAFRVEEAAFAFDEMLGCCEALGLAHFAEPLRASPVHTPVFYFHLANDECAQALARRSIFVRVVLELWAEGAGEDAVKQALRDAAQMHAGILRVQESTFRIELLCVHAHYTNKQRLQRYALLEGLPLRGKVNLHGAEMVVWLVDLFKPRRSMEELMGSAQFTVVGKQVAAGTGRSALDHLCLKKRRFVGTTSMAANWSLSMANLARVDRRSFVDDPFAGSGSLLVAAAHLGARRVMGSDISLQTLRGEHGFRPKGVLLQPEKAGLSAADLQSEQQPLSMAANFAQYGLGDRLLDVLASDQAHSPWRFGHSGFFDAIITDPPYGVRAGAKRTAPLSSHRNQGANVLAIPHEQRVVKREAYEVHDVVADLLCYAARALITSGHLVFWYPAHRQVPKVDLPSHPAFRIVAAIDHPITTHMRRYLLVYRKCAQWSPALDAAVVVHPQYSDKLGLRHHSKSSVEDSTEANPRNVSPMAVDDDKSKAAVESRRKLKRQLKNESRATKKNNSSASES